MSDNQQATQPASGVGGYATAIDGLRGIAILGVLVTHWLPKTNVFNLLPLGDLGVQLFFVISGFLITQILLNCRSALENGQTSRAQCFKAFYMRRLLRIAPAFYICLALLYWVDYPTIRQNLGWHATYLSNVYFVFQSDEHIGRTAHFWSLAVEEQYYLVWPLVVWFAPRKWLVAITLASIAAAPLFRIFASLFLSDWYLARLWLPFACTDSLGAGGLLALLTSKPVNRFHPRLLLGAKWVVAPLLALLLVWQCFVPLPRGMDVILLRLLMAFTFYWVVSQCVSSANRYPWRCMNNPPLRLIGKVSYGMYVMHMFVPELLTSVFGISLESSSSPMNFATLFIVTMFLSCALYFLIELPILSYKKMFPYQLRATDK
jgi:peptidoglycan/LPS O-acetylase OafA/YrhL